MAGRGPNPFPQGLGFDPARSNPAAPSQGLITNSRVELPSAAYALDLGVCTPFSITFALRFTS